MKPILQIPIEISLIFLSCGRPSAARQEAPAAYLHLGAGAVKQKKFDILDRYC